MVSAIGSGMSAMSGLFSMQMSNTTATTSTETSDFSTILGSNNQTEAIGAQSCSTDSEMDLNGDGVVTIDEIMKYLEMQMRDNMMSDFEATMDNANPEDSQMSASTEAPFNNNSFKVKQAISAYQSQI